jgi:hypothetical protein
MPVTPITPVNISNSTSYQVNLASKPGQTQSTFRQLTGSLLEYNPDLPPQQAQKFINDSYRRIIDARMWAGLMVKGQVVVPNTTTQGTVAVTTGSQTVTGAGTAWTTNLIGQQFRIGFSNPTYTVIACDPNTTPQTLTLDLPWGGIAYTGAGYQIYQSIVSLGYNIKRLLAMVNQAQGYRLKLGMPQEVLNIFDTWRTQTGWTWMAAHFTPSSSGDIQYELYPSPTFQQAFPFLAYVQPPDMVNDNDYPYSFIRGDVILYGAIPHALLWRGKNNKYYDPVTAEFYMKLYAVETEKMSRVDDSAYLQDLGWDFGNYPFTQYGSDYFQSHSEDPFSAGV